MQWETFGNFLKFAIKAHVPHITQVSIVPECRALTCTLHAHCFNMPYFAADPVERDVPGVLEAAKGHVQVEQHAQPTLQRL